MRMNRAIGKTQGLLLIAVALAIAGCSRGNRLETAPVHGKVTYQAKPLPTGSVIFVPVTAGPTAEANLQPDGTYTLGTYDENDGVVPGEYKVMIIAMSESPTPLEAEDVKPGAGPKSLIPSRYGDTEKSGLRATVKADADNEINFELTDK